MVSWNDDSWNDDHSEWGFSRRLRHAPKCRWILYSRARPMVARSNSIEVGIDVAERRPVEWHAASVRFQFHHRVVGDCDPILDQVAAPLQESVEHRGKAGEVGARCFDQRMIGLAELVFGFRDRLNGQGAERLVEMYGLPKLPARDIGAFLPVAREQLLAVGLVREVLNDRVRFPQDERFVHQRRDHRVWIQRTEIPRAECAREKIPVLNLYIEAEMTDDSFDLAAVRRTYKRVQFHVRTPWRVGLPRHEDDSRSSNDSRKRNFP